MFSILDKYKELGKNAYLIFADAEKCIDMTKDGLREREARMIVELNKEARIKVITPCGETEKITVRNIVKQGTIFGPILCCSSTGRIDEMGKGNTESVVSPKMNIGTLIYLIN